MRLDLRHAQARPLGDNPCSSSPSRAAGVAARACCIAPLVSREGIPVMNVMTDSSLGSKSRASPEDPRGHPEVQRPFLESGCVDRQVRPAPGQPHCAHRELQPWPPGRASNGDPRQLPSRARSDPGPRRGSRPRRAGITLMKARPPSSKSEQAGIARPFAGGNAQAEFLAFVADVELAAGIAVCRGLRSRFLAPKAAPWPSIAEPPVAGKRLHNHPEPERRLKHGDIARRGSR